MPRCNLHPVANPLPPLPEPAAGAPLPWSSPYNSTASFSIGFTDGDGFMGMVDDVRIYGDPLTEPQVKELAAGKQAITPTP